MVNSKKDAALGDALVDAADTLQSVPANDVPKADLKPNQVVSRDGDIITLGDETADRKVV
ncbi:hypothetical protein HQ524_03635 [Candidatus Uhrbacteria bacterium]|nr:hypothetical protein [Candidatus Uhrbacteria bacterium]